MKAKQIQKNDLYFGCVLFFFSGILQENLDKHVGYIHKENHFE